MKNIGLPNTPAGARMGEFLELFNSGDIPSFIKFLQKNYAEDVEQLGIIEEYSLRFNSTQGLELLKIENSTNRKIEVLLSARLTKQSFSLVMEIEDDLECRILRFGLKKIYREVNSIPQADMGLIIKNLEISLAELIKNDLFSGAVLVAKGGEVIFETMGGYAHKGYKIPNSIDTKFNIASMNKMFTSVALAQLFEKGAISFEDIVSKYVPELPFSHDINLHHLLTHTSGMGDIYGDKLYQNRNQLRYPSDFLTIIKNDPPKFKPGTEFSYSNAGYIVLGLVIERVTGMSYSDYVKEHVYMPAGMFDTGEYDLDVDEERVAVGYTNYSISGTFIPNNRRNNLLEILVRGGPAGGGYTTTHDLLNFDKALFKNLLLKESSKDLLFEPKIQSNLSRNSSYGYGFSVSKFNYQRIVGHSGVFPGVSCQIDMYLDTGITVIVLSNYDRTGVQICNDLRNQITRIPVIA